MPDNPDMSAFGIKQTIRERDAGAEDLPTLEDVVEEKEQELQQPTVEEPVVEVEESETGAFIQPDDSEPVEEETEEEEEEGDEYDAMVRRAVQRSYENDTPKEPEQETDVVDYARRLGAIEAEATAKIEAAEAKLRAYEEARATPETEEAPEDEALDLSDPRMVQAFQEAAGDPEKLAKLVGAVVTYEAQRLTKAEVGPLKAQVENITATREASQAKAQLGAEVSAGLQAAYQMGGIEAALVKEYAENQDNSLIVQYLNANPDTPKTQQGILSSVMTIARAVQRENDAKPEAQDDKPKPKLVSGNRQTSASQRGTETIKRQKPKVGDGNEAVRAAIKGARPQSKKLKFMND
jgi:hypothetical protein